MAQFAAAESYWSSFPETYRAEQIATIARWIAIGDSGVVIGGSGTGKSNIAGYINARGDVMAQRLPAQIESCCFLHVDVNSLPVVTSANFYRAMLQSLCLNGSELVPQLSDELLALLSKIPAGDDSLALYFSLLRAHQLLIQRAGKRVIWLIDRFDEACKKLEAGTLNGMRSLRDQFKGRLSYVVFTRLPLARLRNPAEFDEFHEIMVRNSCWVGPMVQRDAEWIAAQMAERYGTSFEAGDVATLLAITGKLPAFMKAACAALAEGELASEATSEEWVKRLLAQSVFQRNCQEIWNDCTEVEQTLLRLLASQTLPTQAASEESALLEAMGLVVRDSKDGQLRIFAPIFAAFVKQQSNALPGAITLDERTGTVLRNGTALNDELTQLEIRLLAYFLRHVDELCEKDALIRQIWPDEKVTEGVRDDSLAQLIKRLRDKLETNDSAHNYIQTVRGRGYRFVQAVS